MDNFENVKVGDKVIIHTRYGADVATVSKVNKATFQVTRSDGYAYGLFRKSSGSKQSNDIWSICYATYATPEDIQKVSQEKRRVELSYALKKVDYNKVPLATLERVYNILKGNLDNN